jgi:molybdopterin molybdotransferase
MLTIHEAQCRILERTAPLAVERVPLLAAHGRVLAEDVVATRALPPFDNSAMDGYAVRGADLAAGPGVALEIVGESRAGTAELPRVGAGQAVRIFTGAPMPPGADTVVIQEVVGREGNRIVIERPPRIAANVRYAGEDVATGAVVLRSGAIVDAAAIGLTAALSRAWLAVVVEPRVAILATGDELREPDEPLGPGEIVSSNSYAVAAQVREAGGVPVPLGIARDEEGSIRERIERGRRCDVVITMGGVSVGDYDLVRKVLDGLGWESSFWKVDMKPGKPLSVGWLGGVPVIGLPGNPASSMVTFELFVRPLLRKLRGHASPFRSTARLPLSVDYAKDDKRAHVVRCRIERREDVASLVPLVKQGSGMMTSMIGVDALAIIDAPPGTIAAGTPVSALLVGDETGVDSLDSAPRDAPRRLPAAARSHV